MKRLSLAAAVAKSALYLLLATACTRAEAVENIPAGTEVTVVTQDGTLVRGKIAKVDATSVTLTGERPNTSTEITRTAITEVKRVEPRAEKPREPEAPVNRPITIPDNTVSHVTLNTALASDTSSVEQRVNGTLASPVVIDGRQSFRPAPPYPVTSRMLTTRTRSRAARSCRSASQDSEPAR